MVTRADIATQARSWLETPFHHQGRTRGVGCDCGGLVGGVAVALGIVPADWWQTTFDPIFGGYDSQPSHGTLQRVCESFMVRHHGAPDVGDVLLMRFGAEPQHLAIVADYRHGGLSMVHALAASKKVVEHRLDATWRGRVVRVYRMPGVVG